MAEGFSVVDRRGRSRPVQQPSQLITTNLNQEMANLRSAGYSMPKSNVAARAETINAKVAADNRTLTAAMSRTASNVQIALPKVREPLSSLRDKNIPFDTTDNESLIEIRRWSRLFYTTHDLVPLLVDIYSKFPLIGLEFQSKDPAIAKFYESLFMDTLDYDNFLPSLAREYWISGEVTSLAHFSEALGVWESEEILNPDNVAVSSSMFQRQERVQLLVKDMVERLRDQNLHDLTESERLERHHEYQQLIKFYPEIIQAADRDDGLDISEALISRIVNRIQPWDSRGTPHMLRSFRTLMMEESLNAAQDAVADRLYSPFILAKLGTPNLGDGHPWIPSEGDLDAARNDMQMALASDFRLMVHHFGLDISSVFGREAVPRFDADYDRVNTKLMQAWGIGEALISGGGARTYAGTALNRDFVTQMMLSFQKQVVRHILWRAEIVAEAQGHYDFERAGGQRRPIYREIVEVDEETGEEYIVKVPKLLLPDVKFSTLNLRDEAQERAFLQQLKGMGVPISDQSLSVNIPIEFDEELEAQSREQISKLIAQAEAMQKAYDEIRARKLPIPPEMAAWLAAQQQLAQTEAATTMAQQQADQALAMGAHTDEMAQAQADMASTQAEMMDGQADMMEMQMQMMQMPPEGMPGEGGPPPEMDMQSLIGPSGDPTAGPEGDPAHPGDPGMMIAASASNAPSFDPPKIDGFDPPKVDGFEPLEDAVKPLELPELPEPPKVFQPTAPDLSPDDAGNLVERLPRPKSRPEESDEQRAQMPKRSLKHGPSHMRGRKRHATIHSLVEDDDFFTHLGYNSYADQIRADLPELEEMHRRAEQDPDYQPDNDSYRVLGELLEHYEYVTGESPVW